MRKKGLCSTCNGEGSCIFSRKSPVLYCEEFDNSIEQINRVKTKPKSKVFVKQ